MSESDTKAIFPKDCEVRSEVRNLAWSIKGSPDPQTFPRDCIAAAKKAGKARPVPKKTRKRKTAD